VTYSRIARHAVTPEGLARLTLDSNLAAIVPQRCGFLDDEGVALLPGEMIVEVKYRSHIPATLKQLVELFRLNPRPASKYRLAARTLGVLDIHA
jgi:hypothetical protein